MLNWYGIPEEIEPELQEFMREHKLGFSSGYIGMLRCYWKGNIVVWQTASNWFLKDIKASDRRGGRVQMPSDESLAEAGRTFLHALMSLPAVELQRRLFQDVPLFTDLEIKKLVSTKVRRSASRR